jgi:S1-C subfamily serine protease
MRPRLASRAAALAGALVLAAVCGCGQDESGTPLPLADGSNAASLQQQFESVVKTVSPSVVQVQTPRGLGSGVVFDDAGHIVTNAHVVAAGGSLVVTLSDGERHPAAIVGVDRSNDIAVIGLSGARPRPATFADSSRVESGDLALALGNPLGLRASVTQGIVSGERTRVPEGNGVTLPAVIQTSAEINPGNSGGALVDLTGRVIGIPTLAALDPDLGNSEAPGIGFAISGNQAQSVAKRLIGASGAAAGPGN